MPPAARVNQPSNVLGGRVRFHRYRLVFRALGVNHPRQDAGRGDWLAKFIRAQIQRVALGQHGCPHVLALGHAGLVVVPRALPGHARNGFVLAAYGGRQLCRQGHIRLFRAGVHLLNLHVRVQRRKHRDGFHSPRWPAAGHTAHRCGRRARPPLPPRSRRCRRAAHGLGRVLVFPPPALAPAAPPGFSECYFSCACGFPSIWSWAFSSSFAPLPGARRIASHPHTPMMA